MKGSTSERLVNVGLKRQEQSLQSVFSREEGGKVPAVKPVLADGFEFMKGLRQTKEIPSDTVLVDQGRRPRNVHLIQRGLAMLVHTDSDGHEVLVGLRSRGWYAGSVSVLLNMPSVYSVRTVTPCRTAQIPAKEFSVELIHNPRRLRHFTSVLCREITSQARKELTLSCRTGKLPDYVMRENALSDPSSRTLDRLRQPEQTELEQLLSLSPEHLSRLIHKMHATRAVQRAPFGAHHG